jgi:hypothetical protein
MRTTVQLEDSLLQAAKRHAAETGTTLSAVLEHALRESLARHALRAKAPPIRLTTFKGSGLRPGVELDGSAQLLDLMRSEPQPNVQSSGLELLGGEARLCRHDPPHGNR